MYSQPRIMGYFKRFFLEEHVPVEDIQVVLAQKGRGDICTSVINNMIQSIVNPHGKNPVTLPGVSGNKYTLSEGDQVIVTSNNYDTVRADAFDDNGNKLSCPVYNGNKGKIISIGGNEMVIDFAQWGKVGIPLESWNSIELAYALTCHKLQGSEAKYIIIGMDSTAYTMLTREWLYTAITRAKKYCVLCADSKALRTAIRTSHVPFKNTMLKAFLEDAFLRETQDIRTE